MNMINYPNIIYCDCPPSEIFEGLLDRLEIKYKRSETQPEDITPRGTYIIFYGEDTDCAGRLARTMGLELSYSFTEKGLPKGAVPLLYGGKAYGGILEHNGGSVILLGEGSDGIIASQGESSRVLTYLAARREIYDRAYSAEKRLIDAMNSKSEPEVKPEMNSAVKQEIEREPEVWEPETVDVALKDERVPESLQKPQTVVITPHSVEKKETESPQDSALDNFLFYGKQEETEEAEAMPLPESSPNDFNWGFDQVMEQPQEDKLKEFIREKPRKVMDPSLLRELRDDDQPKPAKKGGALGVILKIISTLLVIGIIAGVGYVYFTKDPKQYKKVNDGFAALVTEEEGANAEGVLKKYEALAAINPDMVGYITIMGNGPEGISTPVVSVGENEEKYLKSHLFDGTANSYGSVYTKSEITAEGKPDVIILKGNALEDEAGISKISLYNAMGHADAYPTFRFDTLYEELEWAVFSAFSFDSGKEPFLMDRESFLNDNLFQEYINNFYDNSANTFDVDASPEDGVLVILAESEETTWVLAARPLRENETAEDLDERKIVETSKPKEDKEDEKKEEETESVDTESSEEPLSSSEKTDSSDSSEETTSKNTASKKPTVKIDPPTIPAGMRYEQTGLTTDMDKTAKVEMSNVVTLIDVEGLEEQKATDILENTLGLIVKVDRVTSEEKRGTVIKQSVAEGARLSADVPIVITVSAGLADGKSKVPDLIGNSQSNAEILLDNAELRLGEITTVESSFEAGTILSQSPEGGESVEYDTAVNITVSDGKGEIKTVDMPDLSGMTEDDAKSALRAVGLRVGSVTTVTSSKTAGTVMSQECPKGEKIEEGTTVGFKVSNGSKVNNLTVTNISSWSVTVNGKTYGSGDIIKGDYMDIIPYIVEAEMGGGFNTEALKAQAVAAYCWLINSGSEKGAAPGVPMKDPTENSIAAAEAVKGIKVMHGGETAQTYYYAIAADYSANCSDVWWDDISYLRSVPSEGDKNAHGYKTTVSYSASELASRVLETYEIDLSGINKNKWFSIKYDENDAYVREVNIGGQQTVRGSSIRDTLLKYELRSTAFKLKYDESTDKFTFTVRGYGHGVGMSQVGANYYAGKGWSYERILTHYYPGTTVG